ncbi:MAG: GNAT family N-acetyltransferase [Mycoplasmatales bacterium]|nr:GNAT family N-acetyltransferase [Mycoplasmatales bacterium]
MIKIIKYSSQILELRQEIMWPNKDIEFVKIKNDNIALHFGYFKNNKLIAVASLFPNNQIRKVAVKEKYQRMGIGSELMKFILKHNKNKSYWLNSRVDKKIFYENIGFKTIGNEFKKNEEFYIKMKI